MQTQTTFSPTGTLGLVGFGMTTILLNIHNAGFASLNITIIAMGLMLGGATQIIAGIIALKNHELFSGTAFVAYGFFWWSLVVIVANPASLGVKAASGAEMACYLGLWAVFTAFMFVASLRHGRLTQLIFGSLTLLFVLLALGDATSSASITHVAGYVGLLCGGCAMYDGLAQVVNAEHGKKICPLG